MHENKAKQKDTIQKGHTNSILCLAASFLKLSVSSKGTSGTTSPAEMTTVNDVQN